MEKTFRFVSILLICNSKIWSIISFIRKLDWQDGVLNILLDIFKAYFQTNLAGVNCKIFFMTKHFLIIFDVNCIELYQCRSVWYHFYQMYMISWKLTHNWIETYILLITVPDIRGFLNCIFETCIFFLRNARKSKPV